MMREEDDLAVEYGVGQRHVGMKAAAAIGLEFAVRGLDCPLSEDFVEKVAA